MCRLFAFRSVIKSQAHKSLVRADNAIALQSNQHPDGWGVAYYLAGAPHLIKNPETAVECEIFQKVSGVVSSETVLAHIRKATLGKHCILNTHPFQYGKWVFAHNGNIKDFASHRDEILSRIKPQFRRFILGDTDSETLFYFLISNLSEEIDLKKKHCPVDLLGQSVLDSMKELKSIIGDYSENNEGPPTDTYLTFVLTNGHTMIGHQGGKHLHYSTYKTKCLDRDTCPYFSSECEAPTESGYVNHLIFSSEKLADDNVWIQMDPGTLIGVDDHMHLWIHEQ